MTNLLGTFLASTTLSLETLFKKKTNPAERKYLLRRKEINCSISQLKWLTIKRLGRT